MARCSDINAVFEINACLGVTFLQYSAGTKCVLLGGSAVMGDAEVEVNEEAISAVLVEGGTVEVGGGVGRG